MTCTACGEQSKNAADFTKAVIEINNPETLVLLRKVVIPATMGDEGAFPPVVGKYRNVLLHYELSGSNFLYSSDGIPTQLSAAVPKEVYDRIEDLEDGLAQEVLDRKDADDAIWAEIEEIEMSSDVVDIVGTYAELQQYDTSKLHDNDIIKVLQDETHQNETAYYRWSTATDTFSYVGSEGPYYTESEVDALLGDKQDTLIAGSNIQIAADGKTISATDTTYSDFTGATAQEAGAHGLVPAPATSDRAKFLKGDGTWSNTDRFVHNKSTNDNIDTFEYYIDSSDMQHRIGVTITRDNTDYSIENVRMYLDDDDPALNILPEDKTQHKLVAGSNIQIASDGKTISATDTTYSAGTGLDLTGTTFSVDSAVVAMQTDIPTVNDSTLTIQNNGTDVATFTANSSTDVTANIVPPVQIGSVLSTPTNVAYVNANNIVDSAVTTAKLADDSVTSDKIDWTTINNSYSTSEVDTHMKWIDGRTIYKKTVDVGQLPSAAGAKTVAHSISNFGKVIRMEGVAINTSNTTSYMLPYSDKDGATYSIGVTANSTNVSVSVGRDRSALDECYVTIYYTKSS